MQKRTIADDVLARGTWGEVRFAPDRGGKLQAKEFLESVTDQEYRSVVALISRLANVGAIRNIEQFRKEEGNIFAIKRHQIRIGCFQSGKVWYLTHGFIKKQNKWPKAELTRASDICAHYLDTHSK